MADNLPESIQVPVAVVAAGTSTLVAAIAGARIKVVAAFLVAGGTTPAFNLQSHTTTANKTGSTPPTAGAPIVLDYHPDGWFTTTRGEALDLVVSGTSPTLGGTISYVID